MKKIFTKPLGNLSESILLIFDEELRTCFSIGQLRLLRHLTTRLHVSYISLQESFTDGKYICMCLIHRKQCYEDHPWCRRDDDPNGTEQRIYISPQCP